MKGLISAAISITNVLNIRKVSRPAIFTNAKGIHHAPPYPLDPPLAAVIAIL